MLKRGLGTSKMVSNLCLQVNRVPILLDTIATTTYCHHVAELEYISEELFLSNLKSKSRPA